MSDEKKRKKIVNLKRFVIVTFTFAVIVLALIFAYLYFYLSTFNNSAVGLPKATLNNSSVEKIIDEGKSFNILVMGVDIGTAGSKNANDPKRTDTLILAHYNAVDKKVNLVSIPRDTLIKVNRKNQKINVAYAIGGVPSAVDAVQKLLDIQIDYYGKIDYEGFRQMINAIGGLDIDITRTMNYDDPSQNLSIHFKKGTTVHLDGKKAEEFFRWRQNNDGTGLNGDLGRIENQHIFIGKVMDKVKSPSILVKIPSILSSLQSNVETNMDANSILKYGYIFSTMGKDQISMDTIKGDLAYIDNLSYVVYDEAQNVQVISKLNDGKVQYIDKGKLKIKIINGTKKVGLASDFAKYLVEKGYNKAVTEDGASTSKSKISVYNSNEDIKAALIRDFKIDNIEFLSSPKVNLDIIVTLGDDHEYMY